MSSIKFISYKNGLLIHSVFLIPINIILTQLPLTGTFGYEFAALNGLILTVMAGLHTFSFINKSEFAPIELIKNLVILFLIPFAITIINSVLTMFCSFIDGLTFYLLIVSTSIIFGVAVAIVVSMVSKRFNKLIFFVIITLTALIPILEIYYYPQVYFFSPLIGFFPGNIYDEGLSASWILFFHQILIIVFAIIVIYLFIKRTTLLLKFRKYFIFSILVAALLLQFLSPWLGFTTTFSKLDSILSKRIESKSFILHYDNVDSTEVKLIVLNQEFHYSELFAALQTKLSKKVNVYLFNDREQKKTIFGAGNADVAKPWQYSIYISAESWQNTLKHEIAHIFTAEFGSGIFKIASEFNPALIEGMAESLDGISNDRSITDLAALAYNNGYATDINSLFTGISFFKSNSFLSYTYSGSFIQYLTKKYGIEKVKKFYGNGEFETVFKTKLSTEQKNYEESIKRPDLANQKTMADYYFGKLSIIQKVCPRYIGARLNNAYKELIENNFKEAEYLFEEINRKTLNYSSLIGLSDIYIYQNKKNKAVQLILNNYNKFKATPYYYNLIFRLGDLYALNFDYDSAAIWYSKIIDDNPNHQLNYLSSTRLSLIENNNLQEYLDGSDSLKLKILISINDKTYKYSSLPIIIDLMQNQNIDYKKSLSIFNKTFIVDNIQSSYAAFKLSKFMLESNDYLNARKYAALSLRFKNGNLFFTAMQEQFKKANWFLKNLNQVVEDLIYVSNY